jgi:Rad3-related DNA helicase
MMSGTLHSPEVIRDIFGIDTFKIINAENKTPGTIKKVKMGIERNCSYVNFNNGTITRLQYLKILDASVSRAKRPTLVHVNSFSDLPTIRESNLYKFENLITQEQLKEEQIHSQKHIEDFHEGKKDIIFTTRCSRGIDFPDDKCRSIVLTRFPYPNISGLFWKILKKEQPNKFMEFYLDKANRELVQKVARGVRNKNDWIELLSPDIRVLNYNFQ